MKLLNLFIYKIFCGKRGSFIDLILFVEGVESLTAAAAIYKLLKKNENMK